MRQLFAQLFPGPAFIRCPSRAPSSRRYSLFTACEKRLIHERTAKSNQIRSTIAEEGFIFPVGIPQLRRGIVALLNDFDARITLVLRRLGSMYLEQLAALQQWVDKLANEIAEIFKRNEGCRRLATVPGIGPLVATALFSSVGDPSQFKNGQQFAAMVGMNADTNDRAAARRSWAALQLATTGAEALGAASCARR